MARTASDVSSRQLRAVIALARFRSFVAAAAFLGVSQPALSRAVQRLERSLGVALFRRTTRLVSLTAAGRDFLPTAERLLNDLDRHMGRMRELADQQRGYVVVASLMSLAHRVLPAASAAYRRRFPGIDLYLREGVQDAIVGDVRGAVADLGIGNVADVSDPVVAEPLGDEPCHLVVPRRHPLARRQAVSIADLEGEPLISMPPESGLRRLIDGAALAASVRLHHAVTLHQFGTLFDFVRSGLGVAIVPASALPPHGDRALHVHRLTRPPIRRTVGILTLRDRALSPAAERFREIFKTHYAATTRRCSAGRPRP
jgi:LysR family transcriptional regulator, carnitine catabolism transcriptional activator